MQSTINKITEIMNNKDKYIFNEGLKKPNKNTWLQVDDCIVFNTTQDKYAIIEVQYAYLLYNYLWHYSNGYAYTSSKLGLHILICADKNEGRFLDYYVDHHDNDRSNNCRYNLDYVTCSTNSRNQKAHKGNKTGIVGLYHNDIKHYYKAHACENGKKQYANFYYNGTMTQEEAKDAALLWLKNWRLAHPMVIKYVQNGEECTRFVYF